MHGDLLGSGKLHLLVGATINPALSHVCRFPSGIKQVAGRRNYARAESGAQGRGDEIGEVGRKGKEG